MKRFIDDIFVYEWVEQVRLAGLLRSVRKLEIQGVNEIDRVSLAPARGHLQSLFSRHQLFLETLIDLRNSFAHHTAAPEARMLFGVERPTVNTAFSKNGNIAKIEVIEVAIEDLAKSFNSFVLDVLQVDGPNAPQF